MKSKKSIMMMAVVLLCSVLGACGGSDEPPVTPPTGGENTGGTSGGTTETVNITTPAKEIRAVWLATVGNMDWPSDIYSVEKQKKEYIEYLELFKKYNVNVVVGQIRPTADAFFESKYEPWSQYLTGTRGKNPGYDVVKFMVEEAHKRGMEFHAWLNPYRISTNVNAYKPVEGEFYKLHPEWTMRYGSLLIFRPAIPEVRQHLVNVIDEICTNYDVDGIHFDDYFYPYPDGKNTLDDEGDFVKYGAEYDNIEDFRRGNVNKAIEDVHNLLVQKHPGVVFSISPYGVWRNKSADPVNGSDSKTSITNYDDLYADIRLWCEKGWIDLVVPQLYATTENVNMNFKKMTTWWAKNSFDCPVAIGIAMYKFGNAAEGAIYVNNPKELETEFYYTRRNNVSGTFIFNSSAFKNNKINILDNLAACYPDRCLIPFMGRATAAEPAQIKSISADGKTLYWKEQSGMRYVIYKVVNNTGTIVDVIDGGNSYTCTEAGDYSVSVLNADNVESALSKIVTVEL